MPRVRLGFAGVVFAVMLMVPGVAHAGIIDFIWEMSGPRMIGLPVQCEFDLDSPRHECRVVDLIHLSGDRHFRRERRLWLNLTGAPYFATGNETEMGVFKLGRVRMLAFEPTLDLRSFTPGSWTVEHSVIGLSYFLLAGRGFKKFDNVGFKLVPISLTRRNIGRYNMALGAAYTLRIFPNGFTSEQFGVESPTPIRHQGREVVNGFSISLYFAGMP